MLLAEGVLVVDDRATEQAFNHSLFATNVDDNLNNSLLDDVNRGDFITRSHQDSVVGELLRVETVDNIVENSVSVLQVREERQLFEGLLHEAHVLVVVLEDALLDVLEDCRVLVANLFEVFDRELTNGAVLESDDRRGG